MAEHPVSYAALRHRIRSGDLLAWSHRGWGSWYDLQVQAVRVFTRSEYSHVGIAWVVGGRVLVLEAVGAGVRIYPLSRLLPAYWIGLGRWSDLAEDYALMHVGDPYSKAQAIAAFFRALTAGEDDAWQCAEYAARVLEMAGTDAGDIYTPAALVEHQLAAGRTLEMLA